MKDKALSTLLVLFFLSPLCILFYYFKINIDISLNEFSLALKNSLIQSVSTALVCVFAGLALAPGLSKIQNKWMSWIYNASLLPSILPSLFTLLIVFSFFKDFPFGHLGVIFVFVVTYLGFGIVALAHAYKTSISKYSALVEIYQIKGWSRYSMIYFPLLKKDLLNVFLIILVGCFSSLSVPLLASGGRGINVEVFIYELIYIDGNWGGAAVMSVLQLATIFIMSAYLNRKKQASPLQMYSETAKVTKINMSLGLLMGYCGLYIFGYFYQVLRAVINIRWGQLDMASFVMPMSRSLILAGLTIFLFSIICISMTYFIYKKINYYHLFYFMLPSTTLVGFSLYLVFPEQPSSFVDVLKVAIALNLVYSLVLFKSYALPEILSLESQFSVARVYGISFYNVLKKVILPQVKKTISICLNIIFIFSFCEFALIKSAGTQSLFSGVFIERLISSYRLDLGFIYSFIVLLGAALFLQVTRFLNVKD